MMKIRTLGRELAKAAKKCGICDEWHKELKELDDKRKMIDMYIRGIDFCLSNEFPSVDYIRSHFKGIMEDYGIFLDEEIDITNFRRCIALGKTHGKVTVHSYGICEVFAKHGACLDILARDNAFIEIDMFDDSQVRVLSKGASKVHINHYGGELSTKEEEQGMIKVVEKHKKRY